MIFSSILSFFSGNLKYYIIIGACLGFSAIMYFKLNETYAILEKTKSDLNISLQANHDLSETIKTLIKEHDLQLKVLNSANQEKNDLKDRILNANKGLNQENNITENFNILIDRLWDSNSTAISQ